jgi:hypothetical protein
LRSVCALLRASSVGSASSPRNAFGAGVFFNVKELEQAIQEYLDDNNRQPKPFVWTASVEKILEKINRCKAILETVLLVEED